MTPRQAKEIALALCSPFVEKMGDPLVVSTLNLQAAYARLAEQVILRTLIDLMRSTPGATFTRVQDTFIIDTISVSQARKIAIEVGATQHGITIEPQKSLPMVSPS